MKVLVLSQSDVKRLLPMPECIDLMADTLAALARDEGVQPLRSAMRIPAGVLGVMPAYLNGSKALGIKVISVFPGNHGTDFDSHQGAVLLFEGEHGSVKAILDASAVTAIRTAAVSGLATRLLARPDASDLAILGAGVQALTHLEAMMAVRPVTRVRVWTRTPEHARAFAARETRKWNVPVEAVPTAEVAVRGATLICTTTSSREPVLRGAWLVPGAHINAVGSSIAVARELDTPALVRSRLFVDRRESTLNEAGDFLIPKKEGAVGDGHIQGEIGDLVLGRIAGRQSNQEITLFKSLGIGVEDVASARYVYQKAVAKGMGTAVEFGGERYDKLEATVRKARVRKATVKKETTVKRRRR
ncbi:MAG: ornithine cyclodeaminase family protein [Gemmatimonadetes bacterium]|nr:ornithine cyclodeaminase family protein [Gemmatimonadota bacterium]